ncbi:hypothetical protein ILUMI_13018 [Ignelater luminosus]|uniref:Serpin domain-containing protein n=1 Tax=Ignelater luminosus TaxID=2038154 RepID=A0A8K0CT67_IGNLU|nr:hypothetical protein ILUMI_13018 [Ignelater luminosus]
MHSGIFGGLLLFYATAVLCKSNLNIRHVSRASNKFGDAIYKQLKKNEGNIIFSPFSVHSVLSMLALGSERETRHELVSKLFLTNFDNLKKGYSALLNSQNETDEILRIANTIFVDKSLTLRKTYKLSTQAVFNTNPRKVDFNNPVRAANNINRWVANKTDDGIPSMLRSDQIEGAVLVLINAIYFKGNWNLRFNKSRTVRGYLFHIPRQDEHVPCEMMVMKPTKHKFFISATFAMLELGFQGTDMKITFIKPYFNLTNLEGVLDSKTFFKLKKNMRLTLVELKIPKFNLGSVFSLKNSIQSLGLGSIFDSPDLSGMFEATPSAEVSDIVQKTVIKVNEDGATVAASSVLIVVARSTAIATPFVLDRPFLFFLYDSKTEIILLRGRIENPVA